MLTADQFDVLANPIVDLYAELEQTIINDMARRIANLSYSSAAWQLNRLQESGALYQDVIKELSHITGKSEQTLKDIFAEAGAKSLAFDDSIYKAAGLNPIPLRLSRSMLDVLIAGLTKTNGVLNNLTLTTAISTQTAFIHASDQAYLAITTGTLDYNSAIRQAIKNVAAGGLKTINYASGHQDSLDVAVRRTVLTGVGQTTGKLQEARADEMGQDLVSVSAHAGARNKGTGPMNHEEWQGKVYSRSGTDPDYPSFIERTGYGTGEGLAGWNCRHSWYPFFKGISKNAYDEATRNELSKQTVTLNGKKISLYDATQVQRSIERKIRAWKRETSALEAGGQDNTFELGKVKEWQARMRAFVKETGLQRQSVREQVVK